MYQTSLFFKISAVHSLEKHRILELFFKSWVDGESNNEVCYTLVEVMEASAGSFQSQELYRVDFLHIEDAVALKIKGIPDEFCCYIEIVNYPC